MPRAFRCRRPISRRYRSPPNKETRMPAVAETLDTVQSVTDRRLQMGF